MSVKLVFAFSSNHQTVLVNNSNQTSQALTSNVPVLIPPQNTAVHERYPHMFIILFHSSMEKLADSLVQLAPHLFEKQEITWDFFPDHYPNIHFPSHLVARRIIFLAGSNDSNFLHQISLMKVLPRQDIESLDIYLPYFAPGTMERIETPGTLATADTYAQMISQGFPSTRNGPPTLSIYDLHNPVTRFCFSDHVRFWSMSGVPTLIRELEFIYGKSISNRWAIAFPDEGSYKRFRSLLGTQIMYIICGKVRDQDKRIVRIMDFYSSSSTVLSLADLKHVIIVDDLVHSGSTLYECYLALKEFGISTISAYCTHAAFDYRNYLNFFPGEKWTGFDTFWDYRFYSYNE